MGLFGKPPPPPPEPASMIEVVLSMWAAADQQVQIAVAVLAVALAFLVLRTTARVSVTSQTAVCELGPAGKPRGSVASASVPTPLPPPRSPQRQSSAKQFVPEIAVMTSGTVTLEAQTLSTLVKFHVTGLKPGAHGLHVHEKADFSNGCKGAGGVYKQIGNINADNAGTAKGQILAPFALSSVVGKSIIVHANAGAGEGAKDDSRSRLAGGVIKNN
jgi:Cu/Zn superoxide dismutase